MPSIVVVLPKGLATLSPVLPICAALDRAGVDPEGVRGGSTEPGSDDLMPYCNGWRRRK